MIPCWNCGSEKPPQGPCRKCGKSAEERFEQPAYKAINAWLSKLNSGSAPIKALMAIPEEQLGTKIRIDTLEETIDMVIGVQIVRRKKKERPKLVVTT